MTPEEVAAVHVACRLERTSMIFDNPLTQLREVWLGGQLNHVDSLTTIKRKKDRPFGDFVQPSIW